MARECGAPSAAVDLDGPERGRPLSDRGRRWRGAPASAAVLAASPAAAAACPAAPGGFRLATSLRAFPAFDGPRAPFRRPPASLSERTGKEAPFSQAALPPSSTVYQGFGLLSRGSLLVKRSSYACAWMYSERPYLRPGWGLRTLRGQRTLGRLCPDSERRQRAKESEGSNFCRCPTRRGAEVSLSLSLLADVCLRLGTAPQLLQTLTTRRGRKTDRRLH